MRLAVVPPPLDPDVRDRRERVSGRLTRRGLRRIGESATFRSRNRKREKREKADLPSKIFHHGRSVSGRSWRTEASEARSAVISEIGNDEEGCGKLLRTGEDERRERRDEPRIEGSFGSCEGKSREDWSAQLLRFDKI